MTQPSTQPRPEPDVMDLALLRDPVAGFGQLREEGPVLRGRAPGGTPCWIVTRQADVRTVLGDPRFVNSATSVSGVTVDNLRDKLTEMVGIPRELAHYFTDSILDADGEDHTRLRKLVSRAFTVRRIGELRPRVEEITGALLDRMAAQDGTVDLVAEFAYPLPITVICELVGVPEEDRPAWRRWGAVLTSMDPERTPAAVGEMIDHIHDLIARRRAEPADDLLTALVQVQEEDGDRLSADELVTMVLTLVIAGHETTAHLIGGATLALLTHPDQLARLRAEPDLWPGAVHELMRWCGPVQFSRVRYAAQDVELAGVRIRRGEAVQPVLVSANHDPREYTDPDRLDVTRRPAGRGEGHVGFGHGFHYCLGAALARQEGEVALRALFERFPDLALATEEQEWVPVPGIRRLARLPLRLR
ncbi:cytochrome P450 [Pseudonocardia sp. MH-G8]|uniref:cytochrome P450 family protein n=1 Tax=Pseudonocardia sp. MH-G8 TaxID=1854588 RepID=UPI0018E95ABE|nr:cytochrome P450 [Pseudonocardia sp. MH-G8]